MTQGELVVTSNTGKKVRITFYENGTIRVEQDGEPKLSGGGARAVADLLQKAARAIQSTLPAGDNLVVHRTRDLNVR